MAQSAEEPEEAVGQDRLTRQELSWLLAQEARSAATALRNGLSHHPPAPDVHISDASQTVETTLDALDASIGMLTELQQKPGGKPRRGRIDLASLLYEVAPSARITIEPGAGTEVFGDDSGLRRMLNVLVSQATAAGSDTATSEITIRRDGEWVKINVELGPDISATGALERRWLSRMAVRHGGRVELEGGTQSLVLPADGGDRQEMEQLRQELEQAQQLGEAYAREIAAAFSAGDLPSPSSLPPAPDEGAARFEAMVGTAGALVRPLREISQGLRADVAKANEDLGEASEVARSLTGRVSAAYEMLGQLERIAECSLDEKPLRVDLSAALKEVSGDAENRAARHGVKLVIEDVQSLCSELKPEPTKLMLRSLLDHAIAATPRGGSVVVTISRAPETVLVAVVDGGPSVPAAQRNDVVGNRIDPTSVGRPAGPALLVASTAALFVGGFLQMKETPDAACVVEVELPLAEPK